VSISEAVYRVTLENPEVLTLAIQEVGLLVLFGCSMVVGAIAAFMLFKEA
jgi:hypothetical protein